MRNLSKRILLTVFALGMGIMLYPFVCNWWNTGHQSRAVADYDSTAAHVGSSEKEATLEAADAYNRTLADRPSRFCPTEAEHAEYETLLDVTGTGIMGHVEIPSIQVSLPIYHGTEESVLQIAAGHLEGSSLPIGGKGTHCVLSGHRGLPSAKLFTDLDRLAEGDLFLLKVLGETLTYEVDQIRTVQPDEMQELDILEGQDLCTLVTCTPYGINSQRLLIRGHRVENSAEEARITADAARVSPVRIIPLLASPLLLILLLFMLFQTRKKRAVTARTRRN